MKKSIDDVRVMVGRSAQVERDWNTLSTRMMMVTRLFSPYHQHAHPCVRLQSSGINGTYALLYFYIYSYSYRSPFVTKNQYGVGQSA